MQNKFSALLLVGAAIVGTVYYLKEQQQKELVSTQKHITTTVKRGDIKQTVLATGTLQALKEVKVGAQVSGEISELRVKVGDHVNTGDVIAKIDASNQKNERDRAAASLSASKAALAAAQAKLTEATQNHYRQQQLNKTGAATKEAFDTATSNLNAAKAAVEQAKAEIKRSELQLENTGLTLGYTTVKAPMDGVIVSTAVEVGQSVNAVQSSPTLVTLAQTNVMTVKAEIAEADVREVKVGMPASFTLLGRNSATYNGIISSIDPAPLHITNNTTANDTAVYYYGKINVNNPDGILRIGMTANIAITVNESKNALTIPLTALQDDNSVLVLENDSVEPQKVTIGINDGITVEVLEGLHEGQKIILSSDRGDRPQVQGIPF